jgi:HEAT repeat protein
VLTDEASIVKCLDQAADLAENDRRARGHMLSVPSDTPLSKELARLGAGVVLVVPVDEKLEALGRKRCQSASPFDRQEGAKILRHFKSDKNVEILKGLLADARSSEETLHRTAPGMIYLQLVYRKKIYYVRQAAYDALQELGVKVDKPILEEQLEGPG